MRRSKYYIRVMRPAYQRAVLTVEATSDEEATRLALEQAETLTERDWARQRAVRDPPVIEIFLPKAEALGESEAEVLKFVGEVQHAYALLQADLDSGEGTFIAPTWLKEQSELMVADITQDWAETLDAISEEGATAFYDWLARRKRPANVVDFFAEREKRRGAAPRDPDEDEDVPF